MKSFSTRLLGAAALVALATPALAQGSDRMIVDQTRDKIVAARAEPGVAQYGTSDLDAAMARLPDLKKQLDDNNPSRAATIRADIDARIETARNRAKVAQAKKSLEQAKAANASATEQRVAAAEGAAASAQAAAAGAEAEASRAAAENARLRTAMAEYQMQQTQLGATLVLQDVVFQTGRADLKEGSADRLRPLAEYLKANPAVKVRIDGHTDAEGSDASNQMLSNNRASSVRAALAAMGVDAARIEAVGHGESKPVADNGNAAGRQQNRRVEVTLVGQQANTFAALN